MKSPLSAMALALTVAFSGGADATANVSQTGSANQACIYQH
ncbi:hypothetical protein [Massilia scottii]|nr:hypothetical protein [Massilia sp. CCM 9029]MDQ1833202.1 hypothetical protein [Massilia sp. CCM 9029]